MRDGTLGERKISPGDLDILMVTDSVEEVVDRIIRARSADQARDHREIHQDIGDGLR